MALTITFLGDTYFGESYQTSREKKGKQNFLKDFGYDYGFEHIAPILQNSDFIIANLEAPLTTLEQSPFLGKKDYLHAAHPEKTLEALKRYNIGAVLLGNNHIYDYGLEGLKETISSLNKVNLPFAGIGLNAIQSANPFKKTFNIDGVEFEIAVISAFEYRSRYQLKYNYYADSQQAGAYKLDLDSINKQISNLKKECDFVILSPHWGNNYAFKTSSQLKFIHKLMELSPPDLIIGHGAHMFGEIQKFNDCWVLYSLGNFIFNSDGRYKFYNMPPISFICQLEFFLNAGQYKYTMNIYPIISDNRLTDFQPTPLSENEFEKMTYFMSFFTHSHNDINQYMQPQQKGNLFYWRIQGN